MKRVPMLISVGLLLQAASAQAADSPRVLAPSSDWTLDFADERCSLIREFGQGEDTIRLQIDSFGPRPGYRVMLSGGLVPGSDAAPITELRVGYSPDSVERERFTTFIGKFDGNNAVSFGRAFLPASAAQADGVGSEFERSVTNMTLGFKLRKPVRLETGSMAAPFAAMHRCVDDLMASWGIDPAQHKTRSRAPLFALTDERGERAFRVTEAPGGPEIEMIEEAGEPVTTSNRRPGPADRRAREIAAANYHSGSLVPVRVMIDATGQPTACVVQVAGVSEAFRENACRSLNGPYRPALDAEGRPMASFIQVELR